MKVIYAAFVEATTNKILASGEFTLEAFWDMNENLLIKTATEGDVSYFNIYTYLDVSELNQAMLAIG